MKNLFTCSALALGIALMCGCTKKSTPDPEPAYTMTATVNGSNIVFPTCEESSNSSQYFFTADNDTVSIVIGINSSALFTKAYTLDSITSGTFAQYYKPTMTNSLSKSGSVTITKVVDGKYVSGTFNFVSTRGQTVTNGSFTAKIR